MIKFFQLNAIQRRVILAVTFGNILEWFEIYLYAYWAPILSRVFFDFHSDLANLFGTFVVFGAGFLTRPFGAIIFGRLGDLVGRRKSYILSITTMTIPTFLLGCLPTYSQLGLLAPILMCLLRLLQSIPAAGEVPGTICYLYENANSTNNRYITSWTGVGNQIGAILGISEAFLMESYLPLDFLETWGWRISFWIGGLIGLLGIYLRRQLFETPEFKKLKESHHLDKESIFQLIKKYKAGICLGIGYGAINAATFYLLATYIPTYFSSQFGLSVSQNVVISLILLSLTTILLPIFGRIGDKFSNKSILVFSTSLIILLLYPLYLAVENQNLSLVLLISLIYIIPITCISALLAYLFANLFPTPVRFTCIGISFNITDGIIGGFTPAIALMLLQATANQAAFCWFILACSLISLVSYFKIRR